MTISDARIKIHYDIHNPIELTELTASLSAVASHYKRHLIQSMKTNSIKHGLNGTKHKDVEVKLYISDIKNNCILAELAGATEILGQLFTAMDYANIFPNFIQNLNKGILFFSKLSTEKMDKITSSDVPYTKRECEDFSNLLHVVSESGELGLAAIEYKKESPKEKVHLKFRYNNDTLRQANRGAILAQDLLDRKNDSDYKSVLMYYQQTNTEPSKSDGKTGERAIISSIHDKALPVYIVSTLDNEKIMSHKADPNMNPLKVSYIVDVNVERGRNNIPRLYRVTQIIETIRDDE